jgi:hypothetical protein
VLCSSHDAVQIEDHGTPAVLVCTDVFLATALAHAERLGMPGLAVVDIPNPLSGISADDVQLRASIAVAAVAAAITERVSRSGP